MVGTIFPYFMGLYEIGNEIMYDHLKFDFNMVEGLANQLGDVPFLLCRASYPKP